MGGSDIHCLSESLTVIQNGAHHCFHCFQIAPDGCVEGTGGMTKPALKFHTFLCYIVPAMYNSNRTTFTKCLWSCFGPTLVVQKLSIYFALTSEVVSARVCQAEATGTAWVSICYPAGRMARRGRAEPLQEESMKGAQHTPGRCLSSS